jgi:hypothetical protein
LAVKEKLMENIEWKHVKEFQPGWTGTGTSCILFLKFDDDSISEVTPGSIQDLLALSEIIRNAKNVQYCSETQDFRIAWELTGR